MTRYNLNMINPKFLLELDIERSSISADSGFKENEILYISYQLLLF